MACDCAECELIRETFGSVEAWREASAAADLELEPS